MDVILDTIDQALREKGLTDAAASKLAVGHPSLLKNLRMPREGEKRYNLPALMKLAEVLDLEFYFGPRRQPPRVAPGNVVNMRPEDDAPVGFLVLPWADPALNRAAPPVAFSRAWLAEAQLVPDNLAVALAHDVEGAVSGPGAIIALLDTRPSLRRGHSLFCFRSANRVQVSHLTFEGELTVVHPARPPAIPRIVQGHHGTAISIFGKVVWLGQSVAARLRAPVSPAQLEGSP